MKIFRIFVTECKSNERGEKYYSKLANSQINYKNFEFQSKYSHAEKAKLEIGVIKFDEELVSSLIETIKFCAKEADKLKDKSIEDDTLTGVERSKDAIKSTIWSLIKKYSHDDSCFDIFDF